MQLRTVRYQMQVRLKSLLPCFHKSHVANLAAMVVGITSARSVSLPQVAQHTPFGSIQVESRVERFERMLACPKLIPLVVLTPVARRVLKWASGKFERLVIVMDRSMIGDRINLLHIALAFYGRALPLGWVRVRHDGCSDLELQKSLLSWLSLIAPEGVPITLVADREFHSIHLAQFIKGVLGFDYILRIKRTTWVEMLPGCWTRAKALAAPGFRQMLEGVRVTRESDAGRHTVLGTWKRGEREPWLLISSLTNADQIEREYAERFWIEEMFSDEKSRGLNLEATRITDPARLERLLVAVTLAYLWSMQIGSFVVAKNEWRKVDNRGATRTVSLCQIGLRWFREAMTQGFSPPQFTLRFSKLEVT